MGEKYIDSTLLDKAIIFATEAHKNTERRGKGFPYIVHPLEVVAIVATMTADQELLAAAALHDTVEDTSVTMNDIQTEFGERVAAIVCNESEPDSHAPWKERKQGAIDRLAKASRDSKIVALGDKLSNMRAIYQDYMTVGDKVWDKFHEKDVALHEWHYRGLADSLRELEDTYAFKEFEGLINRVFGKK